MPQNETHEMMSAFAAGCMDKDNFTQFKDYIKSGGELSYDELGNLQNTMALLPLLLETKIPDSKLKDEVAKALPAFHDETKEKFIEEKSEIPQEEISSSADALEVKHEEEIQAEDQIESAEFIDESLIEESPMDDEDLFNESFLDEEKEASEEIEEVTPIKNNQTMIAEEKEAKEYKAGISKFLWVALIAILIAPIIMALLLYFENASLDTELKDLKTELNSARNELKESNEIINNFSVLDEFLKNKNVAIIDLTGTTILFGASGKLFISFSQREALLQLYKLPIVNLNDTYQLWAISFGKPYSLGAFTLAENEIFVKFSDLPDIIINRVDLIKITKEPSPGSPFPQGDVYLEGVF